MLAWTPPYYLWSGVTSRGLQARAGGIFVPKAEECRSNLQGRKIAASTTTGRSFIMAMLNLLPTEVERWQSPVDRT